MTSLPNRHAIIPIALLMAALVSSPLPIRAEPPHIYALEGARVVVYPGEVIEEASIIVRGGLIEAVGRSIETPPDAAPIDLAARTVTAGLMDGCSDIGLEKEPPGKDGNERGPKKPPAGARHELPLVHPESRVVDALVMDEARRSKHRSIGFTSVLVLPASGVFRGRPALVGLGEGTVGETVIRAHVGQAIAFEHGGFGREYPTSLMGSIAAIRQVLLDAGRHAVWSERYRANPGGMRRPGFVTANESLGDLVAGREPAIFDLTDAADVPRAIALAREFSLEALLVGTGLENAEPGAIDAVQASGYPVILPLAYPERPEVEDPDEALGVSLRDLERWDAAPENPGTFERRGVPFALGTCRLEKPDEFLPNLRRAIERGLSSEAALAALTTAPARMLGVEESLGTIEAGKIANLTVFETEDGDPFSENSRVTHVFIDGVKIAIEKGEAMKKKGEKRHGGER